MMAMYDPVIILGLVVSLIVLHNSSLNYWCGLSQTILIGGGRSLIEYPKVFHYQYFFLRDIL